MKFMRFLLVLFFLFPLIADDFLEEIIVEEEEIDRCVLNWTQSSAPSDTTAENKEKSSGSIRTVGSAKLEKNELQLLIFLPIPSSGRLSTQSSPKPGEVMPQLMELVTEALKCLEPLGLLF